MLVFALALAFQVHQLPRVDSIDLAHRELERISRMPAQQAAEQRAREAYVRGVQRQYLAELTTLSSEIDDLRLLLGKELDAQASTMNVHGDAYVDNLLKQHQNTLKRVRALRSMQR